MNLKVIICIISLVACSPVFAEECTKCHAIPSDASHKIHSPSGIFQPVYGDQGYTYQYAKNFREYGFNCGNCHPVDLAKHGNGTVEIELFSMAAKGLKKLNSPNSSYDMKTRTCSGTYCHSSGSIKSFEDYKKTPEWGSFFGELKCQGCHGTPPSYYNSKGRENSHFNTERGSGHLLGIHWDSTKGHTKESLSDKRSSDMGCSTCHYETVTEDVDTTFVDRVSGLFTCSRCHDNQNVAGKNRTGVISNKALHVNGIAEVSFKPVKFKTSAQLSTVPAGWRRIGQIGEPMTHDESIKELNSAQYIREEKKCLNVACHLLGKEVRWGDAVECDSCHKDISR